METRKTDVTIEDFEDKKYGEGSKAGRYTRFKTDNNDVGSNGWISSFDKKTIEKLKDAEGKCVSVEITTDKNDKEKITACFGEVTHGEKNMAYGEEEIIKTERPGERKSVKGSAYEKDPVGLAVEIFCAFVNRLPADAEMDQVLIMNQSIQLVDLAQRKFS